MKYLVVVRDHEDELRRYMVEAPDQITAEEYALDVVRDILHVDSTRWNRPYDPDELTLDGELVVGGP